MRARLLALVGSLLGCAPAPRAPDVAPSIAPSARKLVVEPEVLAFVASEGDDAHPACAPLGASRGPRARVLLKFPKPSLADSSKTNPKERVARAYLVLERAEGAEAGPGTVRIRVLRVVEPWSQKGGAGVTWASAPRSEPIVGAELEVPARGVGPLRLDVTPWMVEWSKKGATTWGLRVEGEGEGAGLPVATGWAKGTPPRLEVYLQ